MSQAKVSLFFTVLKKNSQTNQSIFILNYLTFLQEVKRKKTETSKKSNNPAFQESFNFKVENKDDIDTLGVRVTAMQHVPFPEKGR